ncbi:MAG: ribonuclease HI [Bradyrhizobium sp.]
MPAVPQADWDRLCAVAFASERVRARRIARHGGLTECEALQQLLQATAQASQQPHGLNELITMRLQSVARGQERSAARKQEQALAWQRKQAVRSPAVASWTGWFDGSACPNPGCIGLGARLCGPDGFVAEFSLAGGHGDSNQAEYMALLVLLDAALAELPDQLLIHGDSCIVIDDVTGMHCVASLDDYRYRALAVLAQLGAVRFCWIPRRRNAAADALSLRGRRAR